MRSVKRFFARRSRTPYLLPIVETDDELLVARKRAEDANQLLQSRTVQEAIQALNEQVVTEIVQSAEGDDRLRTVLYLKLQVISELQGALMTFMADYDTMLTQREAEQRRQLEEARGEAL